MNLKSPGSPSKISAAALKANDTEQSGLGVQNCCL